MALHLDEQPTSSEQSRQASRKVRRNIVVALIFDVIILSTEAAVFLGAKTVANVDTNPGQLNAATSAVTYAYLAAVIALTAFGVILMVKARDKHAVRSLSLAAAGAGVLIILLGSGNVPQAPTQVTLPAAIQHVNTTAKLLATTDTLVHSSGNKPLGIHVEYAVEYASAPGFSFKQELAPPVGAILRYDNTVLISALEWFPYPSSTLPKNIAPDQSGDTVQYGSYDFFPIGVTPNGKNAKGDVIFCFDPGGNNEDAGHDIKDVSSIRDLYSQILPGANR
jgi:hypothetical protein